MSLQVPQTRDISFEDFQGIVNSHVSGEEASVANKELAWQDTAFGLIARQMAMHGLESQGSKKLTPDEANAQFPEMEKPFSEPVSSFVAQYLSDQQKERRELERKVAEGPQDLWTKSKQFGAGLVAHLMDPLEFGVNMASGWGLGKLVQMGALGTKVAATARLASKGLTSAPIRVGYNFAEALAGNVAGNTAQEAAIAETMGKENRDYDISQGLVNIGISSVAGSVFGLGIKEAAHGITRNFSKIAPHAERAMHTIAAGQMERGLEPDISPLVEVVARETDVGNEVPGKFSYVYEPLGTPREFYAVAVDSDLTKHTPVGDTYGGGVQLTDHPGVANASAVHSLGDPSTVHVVDAPVLKPLDLDAPLIDPKAIAAFSRILNQGEGEAISVEGLRGRELLDLVAKNTENSADIISSLQKELGEAGYNSFVHDGSSHMGYEHQTRHNAIELFEGVAVKSKETRIPDPEVIRKPSQEFLDRVVADQETPERKFGQEWEEFKQDKQRADTFIEPVQDATLHTKELDEVVAYLDNLDKQKHFLPETKQAFEKLKASIAEIEFDQKLIDVVADCVRR
jgi:hypothetical protein